MRLNAASYPALTHATCWDPVSMQSVMLRASLQVHFCLIFVLCCNALASGTKAPSNCLEAKLISHAKVCRAVDCRSSSLLVGTYVQFTLLMSIELPSFGFEIVSIVQTPAAIGGDHLGLQKGKLCRQRTSGWPAAKACKHAGSCLTWLLSSCTMAQAQHTLHNPLKMVSSMSQIQVSISSGPGMCMFVSCVVIFNAK